MGHLCRYCKTAFLRTYKGGRHEKQGCWKRPTKMKWKVQQWRRDFWTFHLMLQWKKETKTKESGKRKKPWTQRRTLPRIHRTKTLTLGTPLGKLRSRSPRFSKWTLWQTGGQVLEGRGFQCPPKIERRLNWHCLHWFERLKHDRVHRDVMKTVFVCWRKNLWILKRPQTIIKRRIGWQDLFL